MGKHFNRLELNICIFFFLLTDLTVSITLKQTSLEYTEEIISTVSGFIGEGFIIITLLFITVHSYSKINYRYTNR